MNQTQLDTSYNGSTDSKISYKKNYLSEVKSSIPNR